MFRIKICGITSVEDARAAVEFGADAIGLNFYSQSPRFVNGSAAIDCMDAAASVERVGVFVNAHDGEGSGIFQLCSNLELSAVQLHGDEPPEFVGQCDGRTLVRARRMDDRGVAPIAEDLEACKAAGRLPDAVLVDACTPGRYGGTGETVSWAGLADYRKWLGDVPLILAGGLTHENVAEAIRIVRPHGVDTASGVESAPGVKDHQKMQSFINAAKVAFESL